MISLPDSTAPLVAIKALNSMSWGVKAKENLNAFLTTVILFLLIILPV